MEEVKEIYALRTIRSGYEVYIGNDLDSIKTQIINNIAEKEVYELSKFEIVNRDCFWDEIGHKQKNEYRKKTKIELKTMSKGHYRNYYDYIKYEYDKIISTELKVIDIKEWNNDKLKDKIMRKIVTMRRENLD